MGKFEKWGKWIAWGLPIYFLISAGKDLYLCHVLAEADGLGLKCIFQFWFTDEHVSYSELHVKALLRMQSAFYMVLIAFIFAAWAFTNDYLHKKNDNLNTASPSA